MTGRRPFFLFTVLAFGYAFLYVPIASLVVYSFNASRLVTVWGGFSTRWYGELLGNESILSAAWLSLRVAAMNATAAMVLGTLTGLALARFGRFRGRTLLSAMVSAPLVMPDVILGLASLLLFVAMEQLVGWPEGRGVSTILIAHVTFSAAYVTVVVQSRLVQMDVSVEEAAMDLGARPWKVFLVITLPAGLHPLARRPGDRELRLRPRRHHPADGGLLQRAARGQPADQRAGDHHRRGRDRRHPGCRLADASPGGAAPARDAPRRQRLTTTEDRAPVVPGLRPWGLGRRPTGAGYPR